MRRLVVTAFVLAGGFAGAVEAGSLPKPVSTLAKLKAASVTHGVRGPERKVPAAPGLEARGGQGFAHPTHGVRGK